MVEKKRPLLQLTQFNQMNSDGVNQIFAVSETVKDFIFDLHDSTRRSFRVEDVSELYDRFKVAKIYCVFSV